jgi:hypothetical protein
VTGKAASPRRAGRCRDQRGAAVEPVDEVAMEHRKIAAVERAGEAAAVPLTRIDRLARWAEALDRLEGAELNALLRTEHILRGELTNLRADNSPLAVAFEDPLLRIAGLRDDTYGEAKRFFDLSDHELHWIICSCHFGRAVAADTVAGRVRAILSRPAEPVGRWLMRLFFGRVP